MGTRVADNLVRIGILILLSISSAFSDEVEIKIGIESKAIDRSLKALGLVREEAEVGRVVYVDNQSQAFRNHHAILRFRKSEEREDVTVKIRPFSPGIYLNGLRKKGEIQFDQVQGQLIRSFGIRRDNDDFSITLLKNDPQRALDYLSKSQRSLLESIVGTQALSHLKILGPAHEWLWRNVKVDKGLRMNVELWRYADGSRILELSQKVLDDGWKAEKKCLRALTDLEIPISNNPIFKTGHMYDHH